MYSMWNVERSWPDFENEGRERERDDRETRREQTRMHQRTSRARVVSQARPFRAGPIAFSMLKAIGAVERKGSGLRD